MDSFLMTQTPHPQPFHPQTHNNPSKENHNSLRVAKKKELKVS